MPWSSPYTPQMRAAVEERLRSSDLPFRQVALEFGLPPTTVYNWHCKLRRGDAGASERRRAPTSDTLDARLRRLIARQITAFEARLATGDDAIDSARMLRDLGGLRRLIDDVRTSREKPGGDADADSTQDPAADLAARRARLARQLDAFTAEGLAGRLSRDAVASRSGEPGG